MVFGIFFAAIDNERFAGGLDQSYKSFLGEWMIWGNGQAKRVVREIFEMQSPQHGPGGSHQKAEVELILTHAGEHLFSGPVMPYHAHTRLFRLKEAQGRGQNARGERRRIT